MSVPTLDVKGLNADEASPVKGTARPSTTTRRPTPRRLCGLRKAAQT